MHKNIKKNISNLLENNSCIKLQQQNVAATCKDNKMTYNDSIQQDGAEVLEEDNIM